MRALGVDLGIRRIGVALGESGPRVASPRAALPAAGALACDAEQVAALARREEVEIVVVGLPLEPDGNEGRMARVCRRFAAEVEARGLTVALVDERLTSREADAAMADTGLSLADKKARRDGEAACRILERWFDGA